jgi:hypothetical protein
MSLAPGPLNVLCQMSEPFDWETVRLTPRSAGTSEGAVFCVADRLTIALSGAKVWCPATPLDSWHAATVVAGLAVLAEEMRTHSDRGGLQALIPLLIGGTALPPEGMDAASALIRSAVASIAPLADWLETCLGRPAETIPVPTSAIDALIGLGPGLTPSGDDFLGGVLIALRHLGVAEPTERLAEAIVSRAEQRTNEISRAHLSAAAGGEGLAPLHAVLSSLCAPGAARMDVCLAAIDAIGHTSGWDALVGIALAAAIVARVRTARGDVTVAM